jgi:pyruvate dehydrogenase E1 component beta subunit
MDQIVNSAGKLRYISGGQFSFPMVVMSMTGTGWGVGAQHNHNLEAWFVHSPGVKVVMPSTPDDFKGLLKTAIRDDNPVMFFTDLALLHQAGEVPEGDHVVPLGKARIRRTGRDVTIISYAKTVHTSLKAADALATQGISAEVLDLRTLKPLDEDTIVASARRTGRVIVVHEANRTCGVGAEVAAIVAERAWSSLKAPVVRITSPDTPAPASFALEAAFTPQVEQIVAAAQSIAAPAEAAFA